MRTEFMWGDHRTLLAMARMLGLTIHLVGGGKNENETETKTKPKTKPKHK